MPERAWAATVLARGEELTACSEEGAVGRRGRSGGERRKEFLRMPGWLLDEYGVMMDRGDGCTLRPLGW